MKIKPLEENIYAGDNNNKKNKRKYKHAMSPFCSLNAGNVEKNIEMFNHMSNVGDAPSSAGGDNGGAGMGESLMNEDLYSDNVGKWISDDTYIPELNEEGIPYLPKEFWEDWD